MSEDNPFRIFVTHCFSDDPDYVRVFEYLESSSNFFYRNCSNPSNVPSAGGKEALKDELRAQIEEAEIVLIPGRMFIQNEDWIRYQMIAAEAMGLPMVALEIFGGVGEVHPEVAKRVKGTVGWNECLIVDAIRQHARGEDANRFETIEFEMP
jgi:hypothetical protein